METTDNVKTTLVMNFFSEYTPIEVSVIQTAEYENNISEGFIY